MSPQHPLLSISTPALGQRCMLPQPAFYHGVPGSDSSPYAFMASSPPTESFLQASAESSRVMKFKLVTAYFSPLQFWTNDLSGHKGCVMIYNNHNPQIVMQAVFQCTLFQQSNMGQHSWVCYINQGQLFYPCFNKDLYYILISYSSCGQKLGMS